MALDNSILVELPEHGIAYKKVSGKTYVYYVTATYRNKNGNPTCDRSSIGRLDEASGKLIPNRNYYEIYLKQPASPAGDILSCGVYRVFDQICGELGIKKLLDRYFPEHAAEMLTAAQYMLSEGNVMWGPLIIPRAAGDEKIFRQSKQKFARIVDPLRRIFVTNDGIASAVTLCAELSEVPIA